MVPRQLRHLRGSSFPLPQPILRVAAPPPLLGERLRVRAPPTVRLVPQLRLAVVEPLRSLERVVGARGALGVELPPRRDLARRRVLRAGVCDGGGFQLRLLL